MTTAPAGRAILVAALALLPIAHVASFVWSHGVDCPVEDEWELVPFIERMHAGTLDPSDLWTQHNEHRILFPRAIMLGLAWLTGWNLRAEMAASLALALACLGVLVHQGRATWRALGREPPPWLLPAFAALVFSLAQWENWLRGWQLQIILAWVSALGAFALLAGRAAAWRLAAAVTLAGVATFSFGAGALVWPAGAAVLALRPRESRGRPLAIWLAAMALTVAVYAIGFVTPARHAGLTESLAHPLATIVFFLAALGSPVDPVRNVFVAAAATLVGAVVLGRAAARLAADAPVAARPQLGFWVAVVLLVVGTAALTALARTAMFGPLGALSSRYVTLAVPWWAAVVVALGLEASAATGRARGVCVGGVALVALLGAATSLQQEPAARREVASMRQASAALVADHPDVYEVLCFYAPPELTRARAMTLRRLKLTVFRAERSGHPSGR